MKNSEDKDDERRKRPTARLRDGAPVSPEEKTNDSAVAKLKPYCSCAGDLFEIGLGENALSDEIRAALYDLFVIKNVSGNN